MKLCCSSRSHARVLQSGALTQLEWVDLCAAELKLDGVEFAASHFPRTDDDYLAQLKKLCVDRGLTVASVAVDIPFGEGDVDRQTAELDAWTARSLTLGSPLLRVSCGAAAGSPGIAWRELVRGLKMACLTAKDRNVTVGLEAKERTLIATAADSKRALKECDSAWLRIAPTLSQLNGELAPEWNDLLDVSVLVVSNGGTGGPAGFAALRDRSYIGFVSLDYDGGEGDVAGAVAALRSAIQ